MNHDDEQWHNRIGALFSKYTVKNPCCEDLDGLLSYFHVKCSIISIFGIEMAKKGSI